jgi:hypothetical protein
MEESSQFLLLPVQLLGCGSNVCRGENLIAVLVRGIHPQSPLEVFHHQVQDYDTAN